MSIENKMRSIQDALSQKCSVLVAFSGGVDSSVLAALAHRALGDMALAVTADSQTLAPGELDCAKKVAHEIGIRHIVITYDELNEPGFSDNPPDRCYYCKKGLFRELGKIACSCFCGKYRAGFCPCVCHDRRKCLYRGAGKWYIKDVAA